MNFPLIFFYSFNLVKLPFRSESLFVLLVFDFVSSVNLVIDSRFYFILFLLFLHFISELSQAVRREIKFKRFSQREKERKNLFYFLLKKRSKKMNFYFHFHFFELKESRDQMKEENLSNFSWFYFLFLLKLSKMNSIQFKNKLNRECSSILCISIDR